jgi:hypothetical protein
VCSLFSFRPVVSQWIFWPVSLIQQKQKCEMQDSSLSSGAINDRGTIPVATLLETKHRFGGCIMFKKENGTRLPTAVVFFSVSKMLRD